MKSILLILTVFFGVECTAQMYTINGIIIKSNLSYPEINRKTKVNQDSTYQLQITDNIGNPICSGKLISLDPEIKEGNFTFFSPTNKPIAIGKYYDGYPSGIWKYFNEEGEIDKELDYNSTIQFLNERTNIQLDEPPLFLTNTMPKFQGGDGNEFMHFLQENIVYPINSQINKIQGRVFVEITIDEVGKIVNPEIIRGLDVEINMEVYRLLSIAPNWTPGIDKHGKTKNITFTLPIEFELIE